MTLRVSELRLDSGVDMLIDLAIAEDLGTRGDVTSQAIISPQTRIESEIVAKAVGVLAGLPLVRRVYAQIDPHVTITELTHDGEHIVPGTVLCRIEGSAVSILSGERIALNFLQHLSGIATRTAQFVKAVEGTGSVILDTRKTTPGWRALEKYAVRTGGGQNHRAGLYDMVLIKNNHIDAAGGVAAAIQAVLNEGSAYALPIEVEVRSLDELREALSFDGLTRILLDNMSEGEMRRAVELVDGRVPLEASGNMTLERVRTVAETGVQFISVGALTHSAPALDLSMHIRIGEVVS